MVFMDEKIIQLENAVQQEHERLKKDKENQCSQEQTETFKISPESIAQHIKNGSVTIKDKTIDFEKQSFCNDRIQLCFPKEFFICALDEAESAIYKNDENDVNAIFSVVKKETRTLKMPDLKKQIIQNMKSMDLYTEWIEDGALDIEGNAIPFCLFSNPVANGKVFNLMFFISLGKNNLIVNINGNANDLWLWEPIGKGMLQTLEINQK